MVTVYTAAICAASIAATLLTQESKDRHLGQVGSAGPAGLDTVPEETAVRR